jgi:RimJ/RimL family protein N-acetyltransferase
MTVLSTERLVLRPPTEADFEAWAGFDADARATAFFGGPIGRAAAWTNLATVAGMWALRGYGLFSVFEAQGGRWVGRVGPWAPEGHPGTEVGWALTPSAWGRGYATEAARAAMAWAFDSLGWTEIIHCIDPANTASIAVAERLGSRKLREQQKDGALVAIYGQSRL